MKILIMGLPGSGKTTLAKSLSEKLKAQHLNADMIRIRYNDWDFSFQGRIRQAERMATLSDLSSSYYVVADFVAPILECRSIFDADYTIWMNTIKSSRYSDTNSLFEIPTKVDLEITNFNYSVDEIVDKILSINIV